MHKVTSMNKIAELTRLAEVRGTLAAFIDGGLLNMDVNDTEGFNKLACDVSAAFGDSMDYTVEDVLCKTAEILGAAPQEKTAEEDVQFALGGLMLSKLAGEMSDEEFGSAVNGLLKEASFFKEKSKMQQVGEAISDKMDDLKEGAIAAGKKVRENISDKMDDLKDATDDAVKTTRKKLKAVKKDTAKAVRTGAKKTVEFAAKNKKGLAAGAAGAAGLTAAGLAAYSKMRGGD